jgi:hypothetical protein
MITEKALMAISPLARQLSDAGQNLSAAAGTPLGGLVAANLSAAAYALAGSPDSPIPTGMLLDDSKRRGPSGDIEHDEAMKELVGLASEAVLGNFHTARNVVIPTVKSVHTAYTDVLRGMEIDAKQPVSIIPNVYHDVWNSPQLQGLVDRFENVALNDAKVTVSLPMIDGASLMEMLKTGIDSFDSQIEDWFENQPVDKPLATYRKVFIDGAPVGRQTNAIHITPVGELDRNDLLLVFLIASNFEEHLPEGITVDLSSLRLVLARVREQAGRAIGAEFKRRDRDRQIKNLVYRVAKYDWEYTNDGRTTVMVNNDVYKAFLEEGGSPEAIYGAVVSGGSTEYHSLVENKDLNERRWAKSAAMHAQKVAAQIYTSQREAVRVAMTKHINAQADEDLPMGKTELHQRVLTVLGKMNPKDFSDDLTAVRWVVCDVLFAHTNVKMVLDAMDTAEIENPDMSARECALMSVIDLVARWMAAQINVKYGK